MNYTCRGRDEDEGTGRAFLFLLPFTMSAYVIFDLQLSEQLKARLLVPSQLQAKGGLFILRFWLLSLIFSETGGILHRALLVGFFSLQTLVCVLLRTRGKSLAFSADRFHVFSLGGLDLRMFFPLLGPFERWQAFRWLLRHSLEPFRRASCKIPLAYQGRISGWCPGCAVFLYMYVTRWV